MRTLAVIALVMAVARPMPVVDRAQSDVARKLLLVIDQSESMLYEYEGKTLLEHAKDKATDLITHLEPGDAVSLIVAGEKLRRRFKHPPWTIRQFASGWSKSKALQAVRI